MNKEEIIRNVNLRDVMAQRGININRNNMCCCPFHGEKRPSMKVFKDGYKCFACNESGNVIDFVMRHDNVSFKDAYMILGGTYERMDDKEREIANRKWQREKQLREQKLKAEEEFRSELSYVIALCRKACELLNPTSDDWCWFTNKLPQLLNAWYVKYEVEEEIDEIDVIKLCREVRQKIDSICRVV